MVFSALQPWYSPGEGIRYGTSTGTVTHYQIAISEAETATEWTLNSTKDTWFGLDDNRTVLWSNHDIPNGSATATEIYFSGSEPLTELTETVTKLVPVERGSEYAVTSANLNDIAKRTQEMAGTTKLMTPEDIIYWLNRVKFIPHGNAESSFSLSFESSASGSIPVVTKGTATSGFTLTFTSIATGELITEEV